MKDLQNRLQTNKLNARSHMRFVFLLAFLWLVANPTRAAETNGTTTLSELTNQIQAHLSEPRFDGALWGVKIISLDSGKTVFEDHADRLMSPASNSKLYSAALALDHFGPDYRIVTSILASKRPTSRGKLRGDLVIAGRADPSWNARHAGTNFWDLFSPFVTAIKSAGVRHVTGDLIADATFLHSPPNGSGWVADDLEDYYGAEISALTLNDNYTQIVVKPAAKPGQPCAFTVVDPCTGLKLDNHTTTTLTNVPKHIEAHRFPGEKVVHIFGTLPVG
ncbi:MAG TPA: D-alanyl-D-alanine carboxypeptidase, partial [Candidatus Polarisedimenticolia bacterium]|nr:D-alanyl-D-alanine carboxypeptidase [Candidatus Polarisedimenticolia bacterium]